MSKIDDSTIKRVLDRADIVEVISDFDDLKLRKKGARYEGICPFHDDKGYGNFSVYPKGNCYKCFKCGAKGGVVEFLKMHEHLSFPDAIRWLGKKYSIPVDDVPLDYTPPPPRPKPKPKDMLVLPMRYVEQTQQTLYNDNLALWLASLPWDGAQTARLDKVADEYHLGHSNKLDMTIFWQIDEQGRVRTGKMMKYYPKGHLKFGHRDKDSQYNFDFVHTALSRPQLVRDRLGFPVVGEDGQYVYEVKHKDIFDDDKQEMKQCLFGMHLLSKYPGADVKIVESEKTAIVMAIAYGNHAKQVWMACGGLQNINRDKLAPIIREGRNVTLFPDRDGVDKWKVRSMQLNYPNVVVDAIPVTKWWKPCDGEKADIADVVVRGIIEHHNQSTTT